MRPSTLADLRHHVTDALVTVHDEQVDMVIERRGPDRFAVTSAQGSVEFRRQVVDGPSGSVPAYDITEVTGTNPLANVDHRARTTLAAELAAPTPHRSENHYPHALDHIAQFFDGQHAPDLLVLHTPGHHAGGMIGQHGSLSLVAARAPFIASGCGIAASGRTDGSARMVDVAPTVLRLLGADPHPSGLGPTGSPRRDALLARQDGDPIVEVLSGEVADHVIVVLLDGCNSNVLYDAVDTGGAPTIATLAASGTTLGGGLFASLPTATLANHTTASTGVHPGHSGVIHNMWLDRNSGAVPDLLAMDQVFDAMVHLRSDVETVHEAVHRADPAAFTAALFEFCDRGADVSSFAQFRNGAPPAMPDTDSVRRASSDFFASSPTYEFMSRVDELATRQAVDLWRRSLGNPLPRFTFLSLSLTDESGHEAGPYSDMVRAAIADSDRRVARLLDAVQGSGAADRTAVIVVADHGMEQSDPRNTGQWAEVLADVERSHRSSEHRATVHDIADGFVYVVLG